MSRKEKYIIWWKVWDKCNKNNEIPLISTEQMRNIGLYPLNQMKLWIEKLEIK
jgi:hypothetical protein